MVVDYTPYIGFLNDLRDPTRNIKIEDELRQVIDTDLFMKAWRKRFEEYFSWFKTCCVDYSKVSYQLNLSKAPLVCEVLLVMKATVESYDPLFFGAEILVPMKISKPMHYLETIRRLKNNEFDTFEYTLLKPYFIFGRNRCGLRFVISEQLTYHLKVTFRLPICRNDTFYYVNPDINISHPFLIWERKTKDGIHRQALDFGVNPKYFDFKPENTVPYPFQPKPSVSTFESIYSTASKFITSLFTTYKEIPTESTPANTVCDTNHDSTSHDEIPSKTTYIVDKRNKY